MRPSPLLLALVVTAALPAQGAAWKLNVATTALGIPQVGWTRPVGDRRSLQLDLVVSPWRSVGDAPLQFGILAGEWRHHYHQRGAGPYAGVHLGITGFRLQKWDYRGTEFYQEGFGALLGGTVGYEWRLARGRTLDLFIGGGTIQSKYKGYSMVTGDRYDGEEGWNESGDWLIYRGGVALSFPLRPRGR